MWSWKTFLLNAFKHIGNSNDEKLHEFLFMLYESILLSTSFHSNRILGYNKALNSIHKPLSMNYLTTEGKNYVRKLWMRKQRMWDGEKKYFNYILVAKICRKHFASVKLFRKIIKICKPVSARNAIASKTPSICLRWKFFWLNLGLVFYSHSWVARSSGSRTEIPCILKHFFFCYSRS